MGWGKNVTAYGAGRSELQFSAQLSVPAVDAGVQRLAEDLLGW